MKKPTIYALIITAVVIGVLGGLDYFSSPKATLANIDFTEEFESLSKYSDELVRDTSGAVGATLEAENCSVDDCNVCERAVQCEHLDSVIVAGEGIIKKLINVKLEILKHPRSRQRDVRFSEVESLQENIENFITDISNANVDKYDQSQFTQITQKIDDLRQGTGKLKKDLTGLAEQSSVIDEVSRVARPFTQPSRDRFGIDNAIVRSGFNFPEALSEIGDGISGANAICYYEGNLEKTTQALKVLDVLYEAYKAEGRTLQVNLLSCTDHTDGGAPVTQLPSGLEEYKKWIKSVVKKYKGDIFYYQIDSEPSRIAFTGTKEGFVTMINAAYDAAKEVDPNVVIMASGWSFGALFVDDPSEEKIESILKNLGANKPELYGHLKWVLDTFEYVLKNGRYDVVSINQNRYYNSASGIVKKIRKYTSKPIIFVDMMSGPASVEFLAQAKYYPKFEDYYHILNNPKNPNYKKVRNFVESEQARVTVKKSVYAFAQGVDKVFLSMSVDLPEFPLLVWRHQGLLGVENLSPLKIRKKPVFFTYKLLVSKLDGFTKAEKLNDFTYKFSFSDKDSVYVLWSENGRDEVNLSSYINSENIKLTHIVTSQDQETPKTITIPTISIPIDETPIFVEEIGGQEVACGDGVCEGAENPISCSIDCPEEPLLYCGDGICNGAETPISCPPDCSESDLVNFIGVDVSREHEVFKYLRSFEDANIKIFGAEKEYWQDFESSAVSGYGWASYDNSVSHVEAVEGIVIPTIWSVSDWATREPSPTMPASAPAQKHEGRYSDFIKAFMERYDNDGVEDMPRLKFAHNYIQIEDEAQNHGDSFRFSSDCDKHNTGTKEHYKCGANEYGRMLKIAYEAAHEANPRAQVISFSFNFGDYFDKNPTHKRVQHNKTAFIDEVFTNYNSYFDVIGIQCNYDYTGIIPLINYIKKVYKLDKPIRCIDAASMPLIGMSQNNPGDRYLGEYPNLSDKKILTILKNKNHAGYNELKSWWEAEKSKISTKKAIVAADSGVEQIGFQFAMTGWKNKDVWPHSDMLSCGKLCKDNEEQVGTPRPVVYALGQLNNKVLDFKNIQNLNPISPGQDPYDWKWVYKISDNSYIAWSEKSGGSSINLSTHTTTPNVKTTQIITKLDKNNNPISPNAETALANSIPIGEIPVFIEETPLSCSTAAGCLDGPVSYCGDGVCNGEETVFSCPIDCPKEPAFLNEGVLDLINGIHSSEQCVALGGKVESVPEGKICRASRGDCGLKWKQYQNWGATYTGVVTESCIKCLANDGSLCSERENKTGSCHVQGHAWGNAEIEACSSQNCGTLKGYLTEVGCY
jgi:hypothetical protein